MRYVCITNGKYRNGAVKNVNFPLVQNYEVGAKGGFIKVDANNVEGYPNNIIRVLVKSPAAFNFITKEEFFKQSGATLTMDKESDEEVKNRISQRFEVLDKMTMAVSKGIIKAVVVYGPPGVGKSYSVIHALQHNPSNIMAKIKFNSDINSENQKSIFETVKGHVSPMSLYKILYDNSDAGRVLVFDDCDTMLTDETSLNLFKAALDSTDKRWIHWHSDGKFLKDLPCKFEFKGAVIFITNISFERSRASKIKNHLQAILSRCHYIDLTLNTLRDKYLRIEDVVNNTTMLEDKGLTKEDSDEIMKYLQTNANKLTEMSLRMAIKLADLKGFSPESWKDMADVTCCK